MRNTTLRQFLSVVAALLLAATLTKIASATPIEVTIGNYSSNSFAPADLISSVNFDSGSTASPNSVALNPLILSLYSLPDPFGGNLNWSFSALFQPTAGELDTSVGQMNNTTATTYYMQVSVTAGPYTDPGSSGSSVTATTTYASSGVKYATAAFTSAIDSTAIGSGYSFVDTSTNPNVPATSGTSPPATASEVRGSSYFIDHVYDLTINGNVVTTVNTNITTVVSVPEPSWTILLALVGLAPMALAVRAFRKPQPV